MSTVIIGRSWYYFISIFGPKVIFLACFDYLCMT